MIRMFTKDLTRNRIPVKLSVVLCGEDGKSKNVEKISCQPSR